VTEIVAMLADRSEIGSAREPPGGRQVAIARPE
jgi:hypothetical protein